MKICNTGTHRDCLLCGTNNPLSLGLRFQVVAEGCVETAFTPSQWQQGYCGILHGGVIAALLDSAMTHCLFRQGIEAVTAELRVRYHQPSPCNSKEVYTLGARLIEHKRKLFRLEAWLDLGTTRTASAEALFMRTASDSNHD